MAYRTQTHLLGTEENGTLADKVDKELQKILRLQNQILDKPR